MNMVLGVCCIILTSGGPLGDIQQSTSRPVPGGARGSAGVRPWGGGGLKACPLGTFEILDAFSCNLVHILSKN